MNTTLSRTLVQTLMFLAIVVGCSPYAPAGEKKDGGLFGAGMNVLDSVLGGGSGESAGTIEDVFESIGAAQGELVGAVGVPLTAKEKQTLGKAAHEAFRKDFKGKVMEPSPSQNSELLGAWRKLGLKGIDRNFSLFIVDNDTINAFTHVGGYIYIHRGLLKKLKGNPDAIALVLGHEAAHVMNGDVDEPFALIKGTAGVLPMADAMSDFLLKNMFTAYSQQKEYAADLRGMELTLDAGFSRTKAIKLFDHLESGKTKRKNSTGSSLAAAVDRHFSTHPPTPERRARLQTGR